MLPNRDPTRPEPTEDQINIIQNLVAEVRQLKERVTELEASGDSKVEIKTDTGDFAVSDSWDGRLVANTFDITYKMLLNGAWRIIF